MSNKNKNNEKNQVNNRNYKKQPKANINEFKVPLYLLSEPDESVNDEILEVLTATKFNKISIPLGTYRSVIDDTVDENDTRLCTIGYIRNYNAETKEFTVIIFSNFADLFREQESTVIDLQFTTYKGKLGVITKFNIVPVVEDDEESEVIKNN